MLDPRAAEPSLKPEDFARATGRLGDWERLLDLLAREGFPITADRRVRVAQLLWRLAEVGIALDTPKAAVAYLGPVLCTTADDRSRLYEFTARHYNATKNETGGSASKAHRHLRIDRIQRVFAIIFVIIIASAVAFFVLSGERLGPLLFDRSLWGGGQGPSPNENTMRGKNPSVSSQTGSSKIPTDPVEIPCSLDISRDAPPERSAHLATVVSNVAGRGFIAFPIVLVAFVLLRSQKHRRGFLVRGRDKDAFVKTYGIPFERVSLFRNARSRAALLTLKRSLRVPSGRIDTRATLRATVTAWGWPVPIAGTRRANTELVLLVDRMGATDHLAMMAQALEQRLRATDAFITRYDYRFHPALVTRVSGSAEGPATQTLATLLERHVGHRLILVSDLTGLFNNGKNGSVIDRAVATELNRFGSIIVLTPTPEEAWGDRERVLAVLGAHVAPFTDLGLERSAAFVANESGEEIRNLLRNIDSGLDPFLARLETRHYQYASDEMPDEGEVDRLVRRLDIWMGDTAHFEVLAAVAAFPKIDPSLTLALGEKVLNRPVDTDLMCRVTRLPWLRESRMPDWLRRAILRRLDGRRRAIVQDAIALMLTGAESVANPPGERPPSDDLAYLTVAKRLVDERLGQDDPIFGEQVFIDFMMNRDRSEIDTGLAPEATRNITNELDERSLQLPRLIQRIVAAGAGVAAVAAFVAAPRIEAVSDDVLSTLARFASDFSPGITKGGSALQLAALVCAVGSLALSLRNDVPSGGNSWSRREEAWRRQPSRSAVVLTIRDKSLLWMAPIGLAALGFALAVLGLGTYLEEGSASLATTTVAALAATLTWSLADRLMSLGGSKEIDLEYAEILLKTDSGAWLPKPGGHRAYPLGEAIVNGRRLWPTIGPAVLALPAVSCVIGVPGLLFEPMLGAQGLTFDNFAAACAATSGGIFFMIVSLRRVLIGRWRPPGLNWETSDSLLGDAMLALAIALVTMAILANTTTRVGALNAPFPQGEVGLLVMLAFLWQLSFTATWYRVAAHARGPGASLISWKFLVPLFITNNIAPFMLLMNIDSPQTYSSALLFPVIFIALNWWARPSQRQSHDVSRIRREGIFTIGMVLAAVSLIVIVAYMSTLLISSSFWLYTTIEITFASSNFLLVYVVWRYIGPSALHIEALRQRYELPPANLSQPDRRLPSVTSANERFHKLTGIYLGIVAMMLGITMLGASNSMNTMQNAYYQMTNILGFCEAAHFKQTVSELTADRLEGNIPTDPNMGNGTNASIEQAIKKYRAKIDQYQSDPTTGAAKEELLAEANQWKSERDRATAQNLNFEWAKALFQIATLMALVSIVGVSRLLVKLSGVFAILATLLAMNGYFLIIHLPLD